MTEVDAVTDRVVTVKTALVAPAATVTLGGAAATAELLLESATTAPPEGAAAVSVTVPCEELPPTTLVGLSVSVERVAGPGGGGGGGAPFLISNTRAEDQAPSVPPEVRARTRNRYRLSLVNVEATCVCVSPLCETVRGALKLLESSI